MLSFVPDSFLTWVVDILLITGAVSSIVVFFGLNLLLRWFPGLSPYYLFLQIISFAILLAGVYFKGSLNTEVEWREKVREAEERAKAAEIAAESANGQIQTKVITKIKKVIEVQEKINEVIVEKEKIINGECKVTDNAIEIHNAAAKNRIPVEVKETK